MTIKHNLEEVELIRELIFKHEIAEEDKEQYKYLDLFRGLAEDILSNLEKFRNEQNQLFEVYKYTDDELVSFGNSRRFTSEQKAIDVACDHFRGHYDVHPNIALPVTKKDYVGNQEKGLGGYYYAVLNLKTLNYNLYQVMYRV